MASLLNKVNQFAKNIADHIDTDPKESESPSKGTALSLEKAPREDLIEYIKKQTIQKKRSEAQLTELIAAYKKLKAESDELNEKYKVLCDAKDDSAATDTSQADPNQQPAESNSGGLSPTNSRNLEKLVAKLEREKDELARKLAEAQESARAQEKGAQAEIEEYKTQVKQLNERIEEKAHGDEEKLKQLNEKFGEEQERALQAEKERDELKLHLEQANGLVATLQKECDDAKDTFNAFQRKVEEDKAAEGHKLEAIQEDLQSNFQAERNLLKGEIQKLMQELTAAQEKFKEEKTKLEEDMLNVELERRMLVDEIKGSNGEVVYKKEWEDEKQKLQEELEEERGRIKQLREELEWERERKDAFDKRIEGIENRSESERNRTLEAEKRRLELCIKDLEEKLEENENITKGVEEELAAAKQQLEDDHQRLAEELQGEKEKWEGQAKKYEEDLKKMNTGLSEQTKFSSEEVDKLKEELTTQIVQLESTVKELESEKLELTDKLKLAEQEKSDGDQSQEDLNTMGKEKDALTAEVEKLRQLLEESKTGHDEATAKLGAVMAQLEEVTEEKKTLKESITSNESELAQHKEAKSKLESEVESLQEQLKEATQTVDLLVQQKAEMAVKLDTGKDSHQVEKTEQEAEIARLRAAKSELENELEVARKDATKSAQEHALILADKIREISVLEQKVKTARENREITSEIISDEGLDAGKLRNDLSEKEAELFQIRQEMYAKDKAILEGKALLEQNLLQQSQLREDIAEKDEQIAHLKEAQDIQMKPVNAPATASTSSDKELGEKVQKYLQLLQHAQNHINDLKKKMSEKQNDVFEQQKKVVVLNEEIDKLKSDKTKYSEQNFTQLQKNYEQHVRTSKLRIDSLEQQLQSTSKDLNTLRNEYQSYKVRAASALKTAPAPSVNSSTYSTPLTRTSDQEHLIRSLAQEIDTLKASRLELEETKMHLYKLEMDNAQLTKQAKQFSDQSAEFDTRLKAESTRLSDEKQEISMRLSAQKDDLQQQLNLLQHNHKTIIKEKDERISVLEYQVKLLQDESILKAGTIQKLQEQVTDQQNTPPTPRFSTSSPRLAHFKNIYGDNTAAEDDKKNDNNNNNNENNSNDNNNNNNNNPNNSKSLARSVSNSSIGSEEGLRRSLSTPRASMDAGEQILYYAQLQALREEELAKTQAKIKEMGNALSEAEKMEKLHQMQEQVLKQEIRELQRAQKRESTNPEYLKNVIVKYLEYEDQQEKLLPVISTLLQLTPMEVKRLEDKRKARNATLLSKVWG